MAEQDFKFDDALLMICQETGMLGGIGSLPVLYGQHGV